jgi:hypothetical protein
LRDESSADCNSGFLSSMRLLSIDEGIVPISH